MLGGSLRLRLALAAVASIVLALVVASVGLGAIFERHVVRRVEGELETYLRQLASDVVFDADGAMRLAHEPSDPRFEQPLSGLYWEVDDVARGSRIRSRSLWDHVLRGVAPSATAGPAPSGGQIRHRTIRGPAQATLMLAERTVDYQAAGASRSVRILAAIDRHEIVAAREAFASDAARWLLLLAGVLMLAAWTQIVVGLRPLEAVRRSVNQVRSGLGSRITVGEPAEVMPLVAEVNSLLDAQDRAIEQARQRAADLAHGLKTPLQVLAMDAERLRARGETEIADEIEDLAVGMRRHVGRELSRVRLQGRSKGIVQPTPLAEAIARLVRTLARSPKGETIVFDIDIPSETTVAMAAGDLTELAGNLLDNAVKWAERRVFVTAGREGDGRVALRIEDDGPGVSPALLDRLGRRGVRLDETVEGSGLGLAIASDIVETYGAEIGFGNRAPHGFGVTVTLPGPGLPAVRDRDPVVRRPGGIP